MQGVKQFEKKHMDELKISDDKTLFRPSVCVCVY